MLLCAAYILPFSYMNHIHASAVISDRQITPESVCRLERAMPHTYDHSAVCKNEAITFMRVRLACGRRAMRVRRPSALHPHPLLLLSLFVYI